MYGIYLRFLGAKGGEGETTEGEIRKVGGAGDTQRANQHNRGIRGRVSSGIHTIVRSVLFSLISVRFNELIFRLRARFENMRDTSQEIKTTPKVKVNRFVVS